MTSTQRKRIHFGVLFIIAAFLFPPALWVGVWHVTDMVSERLAEKRDRAKQVVVDWVGQDFDITETSIRFSVYGTKQRICPPVKGQAWSIFVPTDVGHVERPVTFLRDMTPDSSRPEGRQSFGRWEVDVTGLRVVSGDLVGTVESHCDDLPYPTVSRVGPFPMVVE